MGRVTSAGKTDEQSLSAGVAVRDDSAAPPRAAGRRMLAYMGICLVLIGLNLRTVFSSFAAVLPEVTADAGLPAWAVMVLTTVPVTLLGVFAPLAPALARRFGAERVLLGAMAVLTAGLLLRPVELPAAGHLPALLAGTAACGAAISLCNVLLPGVVKRDFPRRLGLMGGLYTTAICASAALGAGFTFPVFRATGQWTAALWFWALPAGVVLLLFLPPALRASPGGPTPPAGGVSVWRSAVAWQVTAFMVLQAMMSFSVFAWLAPILRERGVDGGTAGLIVSASIVLQMLGSLFAPALATRFRDQRAINTVVALMTGGGFALSIFGPLDVIWLWTGLLGLGQGSLTAAALTLIMVRTRDGHAAAHLSGMMQGVGYGLGSSGTLLVGQLHQSTGSFAAAGVLFLLVGSLAAVFGYRAGRDRFVGD
ncbi:MFS transporter [Arthrobacter sp. ES3-54]|jgi:CP family cyanate transporter-like MFS transporter|uniref:MFS transporter n=1 Tax=Arthrobacter sp. ES3-54 TaxID=1502991 RepID=UPI0024058220|nr:MFS transporter [Arthrobacter sp. ES3-54]MDF9751977.1 CP family cyanate transporter-like MFS transporter [Arthrobacter sp. ES3-54]